MDLIDNVTSAVEGWGEGEGRRERPGFIWPNFGFDLRVLGGGGINETLYTYAAIRKP